MADTIITGALLGEIEAEYDRAVARRDMLQANLDEALEAVEELQRKLQTIRDAISIALEFRHETQVPLVDEALRKRLEGKTVKGMLVALASEKTPPVFRVVEVKRKLARAGMFKDEDTAAQGIYPVLRRSPETFERLSPGRYALKHSANGSRSTPAKAAPGLRKKVAEIRAHYPGWTREQVRDHLLATGWDFGQKRPIYAVNACFANLNRESETET
jgi:hypothetical protein